MVNPGWGDKVKIGYADDLEKRRRDFSGTGFPDPSHVYAAYAVPERLEDKEIHALIDGLNPDLRYASNKEFYVMTPEHAYSILERIAKVSGTLGLLKKNPLNDAWFNDEVVENPTQDSDKTHVLTPAERGRVGFWKEFTKYLDSIRNPFVLNQTSPDWYYSWKNTTLSNFNRSACHLAIDLKEASHQIRLSYYIPDDKSIFDRLYAKRGEIERAAGFTLDWNRCDDKQCSYISCIISGLDFNNTSNYASLIAEAVNKMRKMKSAIEGLGNLVVQEPERIADSSLVKKGHSVYSWTDIGIKNGDKLVCEFDGKELVVVDAEKKRISLPGSSETTSVSAYCDKVNPKSGGFPWDGSSHFTFNGRILADIAREKGLRK
jgi:hypothetical protein